MTATDLSAACEPAIDLDALLQITSWQSQSNDKRERDARLQERRFRMSTTLRSSVVQALTATIGTHRMNDDRLEMDLELHANGVIRSEVAMLERASPLPAGAT